MTKPINEYTADELSAKINAIKAEREKTANALKRYEEELERKKQEVPLGVPLEDKEGAPFVGVYELGFHSEKSFFLFSKRFQNYVTATKDNAKGKQIDIKSLLPLLPKGKVFFSTNLHLWVWTKEEPKKGIKGWICRYSVPLSPLNIKPAENWETSLMECGLCTC